MERWKKILVPALSAALLMSVLAGCGKKAEPTPEPTPEPTQEPVTAETLLRDMSLRLKEQGSSSAEVQASLSFTVTEGEQTAVFPLDMALTLDAIYEPLQYHAVGSAGMSFQGMDVDLPMEFFARQEDAAFSTYVKVLDAWMRQSVRIDGEQPGGLTGLDLPADVLATAVLAEEPEEVLGRSVRRVDLTLPGSAIKQLFSDLEGAGKAAAWDGASLSCTFWVDPESGLPVRQSVRLTAPIRGEGTSIDAMELLVDYTGYACVDRITVPAEALNALEADPLGNIM